jgi:hypothetical protein
MPIGYITMLQIRNSCAIAYTEPQYDNNHTYHWKAKLISNFKEKETYSGAMTASAAKRISRAVDMLLQLSPVQKKINPVTNKVIKHQLSFITLTIPDEIQNYTAKEGYTKLLAPFLRYFRDKKLMTTYLWKAELQKRGQLHYHITTPSIIHHQVIKDYWNNLMRKNHMLDAFKQKFGHDNPNSTDIHGVYARNKFGKYLAKEFCKTVQNSIPTSGKIWDCSIDIRGAKFFSTELNTPIARNILKCHKLGLLSELKLEQCSVLNIKNMQTKSLLTPVEKKLYTDFICNLQSKKTRYEIVQEAYRSTGTEIFVTDPDQTDRRPKGSTKTRDKRTGVTKVPYTTKASKN